MSEVTELLDYVVTFERGQTLSLDGLRRMSLTDARRLVWTAVLIPKRGRIVRVSTGAVVDEQDPIGERAA